MAASPQSRQPDQPAALAAQPAKESPPSTAAALSIRLWRSSETGQPGDLSWTSNDPAVCLALDLIGAEHGVASAPQGKFHVAAFSGIQTAVSTARRLQWALSGLSEAPQFAATAAAVLVHASPDLPELEAGSSALLPLENAAPGQILLTVKAAELLRDLPGLPLQAASDAGLCELLWRSSEAASSRSSDEEALSRFIQLNGLENEAPAPAQQPSDPAPTQQPSDPAPAQQPADPAPVQQPADPAPVQQPADPVAEALPAAADSGPATLPDAMEQDTVKFAGFELQAFASSPRKRPRWLLVLAVAAAILVVLAAGATVAYKYKWNLKPAAVAAPPASSTAAPLPVAAQASQSPPANSASPAGAASATEQANPVLPANAAAQPEPAKPSPPAQAGRKQKEVAQSNSNPPGAAKSQANRLKPAGGHAEPIDQTVRKPRADQPKAAAGANCDLDSNMLPKMLAQAERSREQGNYPAALRQFRAVLACDRNNARARSGLDLTELAMQNR